MRSARMSRPPPNSRRRVRSPRSPCTVNAPAGALPSRSRPAVVLPDGVDYRPSARAEAGLVDLLPLTPPYRPDDRRAGPPCSSSSLSRTLIARRRQRVTATTRIAPPNRLTSGTPQAAAVNRVPSDSMTPPLGTRALRVRHRGRPSEDGQPGTTVGHEDLGAVRSSTAPTAPEVFTMFKTCRVPRRSC